MSSLAGVALAQDDSALHPSLSISLRDALATGIDTNPEYGEVAASRRATDEELKQGKAGYLPSVDLRADTGEEWTDSDATDNTESMWRYLASLTLTQMLFDGWETKYEVARQKARVNSAANRVRETAELVGLSIVEDYLEVLRQRQILVIARQNVESHMSILDQIKQGVNAGRSTEADNQQADARLAAARATESQIRQSLRTAEAKYRQDVGDSAGQLQLPEIPYGNLSQDVDTEVEKALAYSPTLDIFESDIEVAYAESQGTKSTFYPQLDLELNANQGHDIEGIEGTNRGASALLVMNWNLYRGGADMARSREFIHRHQQAKESRARAARAVENDVRSTWASMVSAGERAKEFSAQAAANTEVVKAYQDQFNLDRRTLLDVLDAQNELFVSRSNTINAEFLEMFAVYRLLALKGALLPTMGVEYPRESALASGEKWSTEDKMKAR
jgi:adhesin transport system outer membrane protein